MTATKEKPKEEFVHLFCCYQLVPVHVCCQESLTDRSFILSEYTVLNTLSTIYLVKVVLGCCE